MTITAKEIEDMATHSARIEIDDAEPACAASIVVATAIYMVGAALVAAIDRNTEARECPRCEATEEADAL